MAKGDQFSLLGFERTEIDAAGAVVFEISEITGPEYKMVAVRKKNRPTVGLIIRGPDACCDQRPAGSIGIDAPKRRLGIFGIDDYTLASPTAAASSQSAGQHLGRAPRDCHFLQLAIGEKRDVGVIRRPERIACSLGATQKRDVG